MVSDRSAFRVGEAAQRALRKAFDEDVALIREGGSIPIVSQFRDILGVETLLLGLALPIAGRIRLTKTSRSKISRTVFE